MASASIEKNDPNLQCVIAGCRRLANVLCYCCQENLCRNHYNEHDFLNSKLNILADEIDAFDKQLLSADIRKYIQTSNDRLQQWRIDCYKVIDQYCDQKYREIEQYLMKIINLKRESIEQLRRSMLDFVQKRQMTLELIDSLTSDLHAIESDMNDIDQKHLIIHTTPLVLDKTLIHIEELSIEDFELASLSTAVKSIDYTRQGLYPIASNNQYLLIHREPNLCLMDRNLKIIKQTAWYHGQIFDMCWSAALSKFFLLTLRQIYILDPDTINIDRVDTTQKLHWLSCTCSDSSLFLSTNEKGSLVCEFNLLNSLQTAKRWEPPDTCSKDERIHDMYYNKGTLLLLIENATTDKIRLELRSSARFDHLWTLQLDIDYKAKVFSCSLLNFDQWLIVDSNTSRLFQITIDGKIKSSCFYDPVPCCACLFGSDLLAISTLQGVNIHKL
jgi:hypothetical protein